MRFLLLCLFSLSLAAADKLTPDDIYGAWVVDTKAVSKEQKDAAAAAAKVEGFGVTLSLRMARVIFDSDSFVAGMWRLDDATATTATLVIQPKGGEERRFHITYDKKHLIVDECPGKLPLKNSR